MAEWVQRQAKGRPMDLQKDREFETLQQVEQDFTISGINLLSRNLTHNPDQHGTLHDSQRIRSRRRPKQPQQYKHNQGTVWLPRTDSRFLLELGQWTLLQPCKLKVTAANLKPTRLYDITSCQPRTRISHHGALLSNGLSKRPPRTYIATNNRHLLFAP